MNVYQILPLDGYELCQPIDGESYEFINVTLNGQRREQQWASPTMRIIRRDERRALAPSDAPWLGSHALVFRPPAVDALGPLLAGYGELLPLECGDDRVVIFNATRIIPALDEESSSIARFANGTIMMVKRYAFREELIRDVDIFKIPNLRVSPTFVSRTFVKRWTEAGLAGLGFTQIWASN